MNNITSGKLVHALNTTKYGAYPLCNPGLLVGSVRGDGRVYYFGQWYETEADITCSKCVKSVGSN